MNNSEIDDLLFSRKKKLNYNYDTVMALNNILLFSFVKDKNVIIYGSSIYKSTARNASDVDAMENLEVKNSSVIVNRFKDMMSKILKNNKKSKILDDPFDTTIICDVKSGWDERFNIDIGYIQDMKIKNFKPNKIKKYIDKLYKDEAFNKDENNEIYALLNYFDNMNEYDESTIDLIKESNSKKYNTDLSSWLLINDWFYERKVLRWNIDDLIKGYLIQNNKKFFLKDTIKNHMTKIDAIYLSKGELNDVSNTIIMKIDGKDNMDTSPEQFNKDLKQAIFEKFYSIEDYDFMKGFKLIFFKPLNLKCCPSDIKIC
jgi:hypothetical protein